MGTTYHIRYIEDDSMLAKTHKKHMNKLKLVLKDVNAENVYLH